MSSDSARVACIIPAKDEAQRIGATITAAAALPHVDVVLVCDDGSSDATAARAGAVSGLISRFRR